MDAITPTELGQCEQDSSGMSILGITENYVMLGYISNASTRTETTDVAMRRMLRSDVT